VAVALAVSTAAFADQTYYTPNKPGVRLKQIYNRNIFFGEDTGSPVQLPRPIGDVAGSHFAVSGPVATAPDALDVTSAIAAVRGGGSSMYTQKEQADQEIGRLIRKLD